MLYSGDAVSVWAGTLQRAATLEPRRSMMRDDDDDLPVAPATTPEPPATVTPTPAAQETPPVVTPGGIGSINNQFPH